MHVVFRRIVGHRTFVRGGPPLVVMRDGAVRGDALRSIGIGEHELAARLRRTGVSSYGQVVCAVWEPTGELSVFTDSDVDPRLLAGVSDDPRTP